METGVVHPLNTALGVLFSVCFMCVNLAPSTGACCNGCELGYECGVIVASRVRAGGVSGEGGGGGGIGQREGIRGDIGRFSSSPAPSLSASSLLFLSLPNIIGHEVCESVGAEAV